MANDDDDYMSDKFLSDLPSDLLKHGLIKNRITEREIERQAKKRKHDEENKKKHQSYKGQVQQRLQEGLQSRITSSNKGFEMLQKMGWSGDSIGKSKKSIIEPIPLIVKNDRRGLGREAAIANFKKQKAEIRSRNNQRNEGTSITEFRKRLTKKNEAAIIEAELGKCQRACEKIDADHKFHSPLNSWFWPKRKTHDDHDEDEDEEEEQNEIEFDTLEKLQMITSYLRTYNYCHFCATQYNSTEDMADNCPGLEKDDH